MFGFELNRSEIHILLNQIKDQYRVDLTDFSMSSVKHRIGEIMRLHLFQTFAELAFRIKNDPVFFELFIKEFAVPETEMFRDSQIWRIIRFQIIKDIYEKASGKIKIWVPGCTTGEELFSICIVLKESFFYDKCEIFASSMSAKYNEIIKSGSFSLKKAEVNLANYERYQGKTDFQSYFTIQNNLGFWDHKLLSNVTFLPPLSLFHSPPENINLVLFRNRMLYYNSSLQNKVLGNVYKSMSPDGFLLLGAKESLLQTFYVDRFKIINESESIYRK